MCGFRVQNNMNILTKEAIRDTFIFGTLFNFFFFLLVLRIHVQDSTFYQVSMYIDRNLFV